MPFESFSGAFTERGLGAAGFGALGFDALGLAVSGLGAADLGVSDLLALRFGASDFAVSAFSGAAAFLLTFLAVDFFRACLFVVLAGLLSPSAAFSAGAAFGSAFTVSALLLVFAVSAFSAGLESDGFDSDFLETVCFASVPSALDGPASTALLSAGFGSFFASLAGVASLAVGFGVLAEV